nr:hypothetical transcript [Hymenolepis microstoma]
MRKDLIYKECVENYCTHCFSIFHTKGALIKHHPILINELNLSKDPATKLISIGSSVSTDSTNPSSKTKRSVSAGTYLSVGRKSALPPNDDRHNRIAPVSSSVGTEPLCPKKDKDESTSICFTPHLSYAEKLLLDKYGRNEILNNHQVNKGAGCNSAIAQKENKEVDETIEEPDIDMLHRLSKISLKEIRSNCSYDHSPTYLNTNCTPNYSSHGGKLWWIPLPGNCRCNAEGTGGELDAQKTLAVLQELIEFEKKIPDYNL